MVPLAEMPQGHELVRCYFVIHGLPSATPQDEEAIERKHNARAFSKAQALARRFGIVIERPLRGADFSVYSPSWSMTIHLNTSLHPRQARKCLPW